MQNQKIVSITKSGQLTVPKEYREKLNIQEGSKAVVKLENDTITVKPKLNFKQLSGSLAGDIKLNDQALKKARKKFEKNWASEK